MIRAVRIFSLLAALAVVTACGGTPTPDESSLAPEARRCAFLSHILFAQGRQTALLQRRRAEQAMHLIAKGTPFAEVAQTQSEDPATRLAGGFMGAWYSGRENNEILDGVTQVLEVGRTVGPVSTPRGFHILHRHPYEEGRRLEREHLLPVWGLSIAWRDLPDGPDRSRDEAEALAKQVLGDLQAGRITLTEARKLHDSWQQTRPDGWMGVINRNPRSQPWFDLLIKAPEDQFVGPFAGEFGWIISKRTRLLRSVVRHMLVQHLGALDTDLDMTRMPQEAEHRAQEALAIVLADRAQWDQVVQRYSDEELTRHAGGSLGCVGPQELPAEVEAAVLATPPGQIHPRVVRSPRGFHVLWRVD